MSCCCNYRLTRKRKERKELISEFLLAVEGPPEAVQYVGECPNIVRPPARLAALFVPLVEALNVSTMRSSCRRCQQLLSLKLSGSLLN